LDGSLLAAEATVSTHVPEDPVFRVQETGSRSQDSGVRVQETGFRSQGSGDGIQESGFRRGEGKKSGVGGHL